LFTLLKILKILLESINSILCKEVCIVVTIEAYLQHFRKYALFQKIYFVTPQKATRARNSKGGWGGGYLQWFGYVLPEQA